MKRILFAKTPDQIEWHFPRANGAVSQGFNDSSKEIFKEGILVHVVREIIQNSLDAKNSSYDKPVIVRIETSELNREIINADDLTKHVEESLKSSHIDDNKKGIEFFTKSLNILKKDKIPILKAIDENTTGLNGDKWDALVYKEGTPSKDTAAAGGSFGIGKNAPYAASTLGLICYSTCYLKKQRTEKFIGRCKLVSHNDPTDPDYELHNVGFGTSHGLENGRYPPILGNRIHNDFRLSENGTGIFIVGFNEKNWEVKARRSIASNFFVAIHQKNLIVNVGKVKITNETLNEEKFDGDRKYYYDLYKTLDKPITITGDFGKFYLKISTGDEAMENRVAYINRKGMFVTSNKLFTKNPFTAQIDIGKYMAVVWAADDDTDADVRVMEPPTHESIEYGRIQEDDKRAETCSALKEISKKIRDEIKKKLNLDSSNETTNLTELADIVSFRDDVNQNKNGKDVTSSEPDENIVVTKRTPTTTTRAEVSVTPDNDDDNNNNDDNTTGGGGGERERGKRENSEEKTKSHIKYAKYSDISS